VESKMVLGGVAAGSSAVKRFLAEAEALAAIDHPNVVGVFDQGEYQGLPYFVMEFCPGGSLQQRVKDRPLPAKEAAVLVERLARGVQAAHARNVLHRDLKPDNVLFAADGTPKVTDFGLAKRFDDSGDGGLTATGAVMGTPSYMAPEQAKGDSKRVGPAADVYALGAVLYRLVTGRPPFAGSSQDVLRQVIETEPAAPTQFAGGLPRDLSTIALKCLQKDPARRYASAAELADDLRRFLDGRPIVARPVGSAERAAKWVRRNPAVTGSAVAVVAALIAGTLVSYAKYREVKWQEGIATENAALADQKAEEARSERADAERQRDEVRHGLYISDVRLAQRAWDDAQIDRLTELLDGQLPERTGNLDLRGFEWRFLRQRSRPYRLRLPGALGAAFNPDATRVAALAGNTAKVWDADTGRELLTLAGHPLPTTRLAWSSDGKRLATASEDQTVKVWDAGTGQELRTLKGHLDAITGMAFRQDGRHLATASRDGTVRVWDPATGTEVRQLKRGKGFWCVAYSPNGQALAAGGVMGDLAVCDADTGDLIWTTAPTGTTVNGLAFDARGDLLASAGLDRTVAVWQAHTGKLVKAFPGHTDFVLDVAFDPSTANVLSGSADRTIRGWNADGQLFALRGHRGRVSGLAVSRDGKRLASAGDGEVLLWGLAEAQDARVLRDHTNEVSAVAFEPGGPRFATAAGSIFSPEAAGETILHDPAGTRARVLTSHSGGVSSVAFSPDGRRMATGSFDTTVRVWDTATGDESFVLGGHTKPVTAVAFSPDGRLLASGSGVMGTPFNADGGGELKLWDLGTRKEVNDLRGHVGRVTAIRFDSDGRRLFSAAHDGTVRVWDAARGGPGVVFIRYGAPLTCLAVSPDGRRLAVGGFVGGVIDSAAPDGTAATPAGVLVVWDLATGEKAVTLKGYPQYVHAVAFSSDGDRIACGLQDGTVRLWEAGSGQEVLTLRGHTNRVVAVGFSADGTRLVSGSADHTVRVWDAPR
jgi:WD40 repeat protein